MIQLEILKSTCSNLKKRKEKRLFLRRMHGDTGFNIFVSVLKVNGTTLNGKQFCIFDSFLKEGQLLKVEFGPLGANSFLKE